MKNETDVTQGPSLKPQTPKKASRNSVVGVTERLLLQGPLVINAMGLLSSAILRSWLGTLEYKALCYDPTVDPVHPHYSGRTIYVFWHEYLLWMLSVRGHCNVAILVNRYPTADIMQRIAHHLGFGIVRGSTTHGAATALRELERVNRRMSLAITPDGPLGPRRRLTNGAIYLASRLGRPLVAMGFGYDRPIRSTGWDRFALPQPYSRARAVVSPPLHLPSGLDRTGVEHYRKEVERLLTRLTLEAETWAESGERRAGEIPGVRAHPPLGQVLRHPPQLLAGV